MNYIKVLFGKKYKICSFGRLMIYQIGKDRIMLKCKRVAKFQNTYIIKVKDSQSQ